MLAVGTHQAAIQIWDVERGTRLQMFRQHTVYLTGLRCPPKCLLPRIQDNPLEIYDT